KTPHEKGVSAAALPTARWADLLHGRNLWLAAALSGGVAIHAVNLYLAANVLPSVVRDIGGAFAGAWQFAPSARPWARRRHNL
ncbi:MAG: hypothetical protein KUL75_02640, partial [Sterolibacterium sp.]|nr:hypothetical protein [Sterolibacterium sp.]